MESAKLAQQCESLCQQRTAEQSARLALIEKRVEEIQAALLQHSTQLGLGVEAPIPRNAFVSARETLVTRIRELCGNTAREAIIVDTSVLVERPDVLSLFAPDELAVIPKSVIQELDRLKLDEKMRIKVAQAIKVIDGHPKDKLQFCDAAPRLLPRDYPLDVDNLILSVALKYRRCNPTILTNDNNLALKAKAENIATMNLDEFQRTAYQRRARRA